MKEEKIREKIIGILTEEIWMKKYSFEQGDELAFYRLKRKEAERLADKLMWFYLIKDTPTEEPVENTRP